MTIRPCLDCGTHTTTNRCPPCTTTHQRRIDKARGNTTDRGYGATWATTSATVIARDGACTHCGTTGHPANPLTADHITPKHLGGTNHPQNLRTLCRRCNSAKGTRTPSSEPRW